MGFQGELKNSSALGFEPWTCGIQAQPSTTELWGNHTLITEILGTNNKVTFGPPDFPILVPYFIYIPQ